MIKTTDFDVLEKKIKRATDIALFCHISPDPDTICSAFAMKNAVGAAVKVLNKDINSKISESINS